MTGPYAEAAWAYWAAGWRGVLPLPAGAKWPPPGGYTGWAGVEPSGADVQAWIDGPEGRGNIALRLPRGVYGLDVDAYNGKRGGEALAAAEQRLGALPPTWILTSRDDGVSGIRLYRAELPPGRRWRDEPAGHGVGIEAIHYGHRYAVAWPSTHPDTGAVYRFVGLDGVPRPDELPELPAAWVEALSEPGEVSTGEAASHAETLEVVEAMPAGEACARMLDALERALGRLRQALDGAALHPAARDATHEIVSLGWEGHAGARRALAEHYGAHVAVRVGRGGDQRSAEGEWWRLVRGAAGKLPPGGPRQTCDCAALGGDGLLFDPAEGGGDDASGGEGGAGGLSGPLAWRLLTPAQVRTLPPPETVVDGLLTMDSESWLIAAAGSYKTFVALDIAAHVAAGKPWMGREVKQGPVLYLLAEGVGGLGKRVRAWEQRNGPMSPDLHFLTVPVQAGNGEQWDALVDLAGQLRPVLAVLDTQARLTVGIKENDNTDMGLWVHAVGRLRRAAAGCVLVVHHIGRGGTDARGASAIDGAQDSELKITRTADKRIVLTTDKQRHLPDDVRIDLELFECDLDDGGTSLVVGPPISVVDPAPWREGLTDNQALIMDILHEQFSERGGTQAQVHAVLKERGQRGEARYAKSSFYLAWDALLKKDKLAQVHGSQRFVPAASREGET
jgi:hypothetical protein